MISDSTILARVVTIGDSGVGKTCILNSLGEQGFNLMETATIGSNYQIHIEQIGKMNVKIQIWDTAGQERFRSLCPIYYQNAIAAVAVYDQTSQISYDHLESWIDEFKKIAPPVALIAILGNKSDIKDKIAVSPQEAKSWAESHNYLYAEVSAKTGEGIKPIFQELAKAILDVKLADSPSPIQIRETPKENQCNC